MKCMGESAVHSGDCAFLRANGTSMKQTVTCRDRTISQVCSSSNCPSSACKSTAQFACWKRILEAKCHSLTSIMIVNASPHFGNDTRHCECPTWVTHSSISCQTQYRTFSCSIFIPIERCSLPLSASLSVSRMPLYMLVTAPTESLASL